MPGAKEPNWSVDSWQKEFGKISPARRQWPDGKKLAVLLTFDTQGDIDAARPGLTSQYPDGTINYMDQMERQYEMRCGLARILRILRKYGVAGTFPTCGSTADWYPDAIRQIYDEGHEVAAHSYWHHNFRTLTVPEQLAEVEDCADALKRLTGERPIGWRSPWFACTGDTARLVIQAGFQWMGDFANDDFVYWLERPEGRVLAVPSCMDDMDTFHGYPTGSPPHFGGNFSNSGKTVLEFYKEEFDMLYSEATPGNPQICSLTLHPRVSGRPYRAVAVEGIIRHGLSHDGVWFPRVRDLLEYA